VLSYEFECSNGMIMSIYSSSVFKVARAVASATSHVAPCCDGLRCRVARGGGGADAAQGRQQDGLLRRVPPPRAKPKPYEARMRPSSRRRSARVAGPSGNAGSDHLLCLSFVSERFSFCLSRRNITMCTNDTRRPRSSSKLLRGLRHWVFRPCSPSACAGV
jgi:hypothetical protein